MTFSGKKLQDIYDSGSARLSQLEEHSMNTLQEKSRLHTSQRQESEQQSKMEVAAKAAYVEEEIKKQAKEASNRIKEAVQGESEATKKYLEQILERLSIFNIDLQKALISLNEIYESNSDDNFMRASDQYSSTAEGMAVEIETQHYSSGQHLRSQAGFFLNSIQQKLDHSLWECRGSEKQSNSLLFRNYMQKANTIESHFANLMQRLNTEFQTEFARLESTATAAIDEDNLNQLTEDFQNKIDAILQGIEKEINNTFAQSAENILKNLQGKFEGLAEQIKDLGEETGRELKHESAEIIARLQQASSNSNQALSKKLDDARQKMEDGLKDFAERMQAKVDNSATVKKDLEEAKAKVIEEIRQELVDIRTGFEGRLESLMQEAFKSLDQIGTDVDTELNETFKRSLTKINGDAGAARNEIDEATAKLLALIKEQKDGALAEIARAAGESR